MADSSTLEQAYRRLLLAYPRFYRRHRGLEILTTMLDAADPGQTRPSRRDALHLVLAGLRCRLVPPGWVGKVAAAVLTAWFAVVLAGVGAFVVWSLNATSPDDSRLASLADDLIGGQPVAVGAPPQVDDLEMAYTFRSWYGSQNLEDEGWRGTYPAPLYQNRVYQPAGSAVAATESAHRRLQREGWRTGAVIGTSSRVFWASRDGMMLRVQGTDRGGQVAVRIHRVEPDGLLVAALVGFGVGLIVAWPATTWLAHRFARARRGARVLLLAAGVPVLLACVINTVDNVLSALPDPEVADPAPVLGADLLYPLANQVANPLAPTVIALGLVVAVLATRRRVPS